MEIDSLLIRKSPIIVLTKMVLATIVIYLLYAAYSSISSLSVDINSPDFIWNRAVFFLVSVGIEAVVMIVLFLRWMYTTYTISDSELSIHNGVLWKRTVIYSMRNIQSLHINQSLVGTLFNFGSLKLHNPLTNEMIELRHIADPVKYSQVIQKIIDTENSLSSVVAAAKR